MQTNIWTLHLVPTKYFTTFAGSSKFEHFCRVTQFQVEQNPPGFHLAVSPATLFQYNCLEIVGSRVFAKIPFFSYPKNQAKFSNTEIWDGDIHCTQGYPIIQTGVFRHNYSVGTFMHDIPQSSYSSLTNVWKVHFYIAEETCPQHTEEVILPYKLQVQIVTSERKPEALIKCKLFLLCWYCFGFYHIQPLNKLVSEMLHLLHS